MAVLTFLDNFAETGRGKKHIEKFTDDKKNGKVRMDVAQ
jgi:hypothetical protein